MSGKRSKDLDRWDVFFQNRLKKVNSCKISKYTKSAPPSVI